MRCILLGAGEGNRLRPHTATLPKCMVPLAGKPLIERQIATLETAGLSDLCIVSGYRHDSLRALGLRTYHNEDFASTNMVASLMCARAELDGSDDVLVCYTDIVYELRAAEVMIQSSAEVAIAVNTDWRRLWELRMDNPLDDAESLIIDDDGHVQEIGRPADSYDRINGQYMGLIKFSAKTAARIPTEYQQILDAGEIGGREPLQMYMTDFLQHWIERVGALRAERVHGGWLEVDTSNDLALYQAMHDSGELDVVCRLN